MSRQSRLARGALAAAAMVALVALAAAMPFAGTALVVSEPVDSPDAIVSLASHEWERLPAAIALAQRYPRALVVLTLPQSINQYNCHDCGRRPEQLMNAGVAMGRIRIVPLTEGGTYGEAVATRVLMAEHHLGSALIVTSPYHARRSLATFRAVLGRSISVGVVPASSTSPSRPELWWAASYDRAYVRYEWAALLYYRLRHHVPFEDEPHRSS